MRIVIDARFYGTEHTGLGRYTLNFLQALSQLPNHHHHTFYLLVRRRYLNLQFPSNFHLVEAEIDHYSLREQFALPQLISSLEPDLFHSLHFNVPLFYHHPFMVTVHDLIKSHFTSSQTTTRSAPVFRLKRWGYYQVIRHALFHSQAIITPSQFVKQDILSHYPQLSPAKIHPIYEAPDPNLANFKPSLLQTRFEIDSHQSLVTSPYLLYVGNAYPHKNLKTLLQAFSLLTSQPTGSDPVGLKLVLVTKPGKFLDDLLSLQGPTLKDNLIVLSNLSDQQLAGVYQHARLLVHPSLMEGFNLTGLEALKFNLPLVLSDIPVHREIYGQAAYYFKPHSPQDLVAKIKLALQQPPKGKLPRQYSWSSLAKHILNLYENYEKDSSSLRSA